MIEKLKAAIIVLLLIAIWMAYKGHIKLPVIPTPAPGGNGVVIYDYQSTEPPDSYTNGYRSYIDANGNLVIVGLDATAVANPGFDSRNYLDPGVSAETAAKWCAQYVGGAHKWRYEPPDRCYWEINPGEWTSVAVHAMWLYTPRPGE